MACFPLIALTLACHPDDPETGDTGDPDTGPPRLHGELSLSGADARLNGAHGSDRAGAALAVGDVDGDGVLDLALGAPTDRVEGDEVGSAAVFLGPFGGEREYGAAEASVFGLSRGDKAGTAVALGDLGGDGRAELVVGAPNLGGAGEVWVFAGPLAGALDPAAGARLVAADAGDRAGEVVLARDLDADGLADLVIGAPNAGAGVEGPGAVYLLDGRVTGATDLGDVADRLDGGAVGDGAGEAIVLHDLDGDGVLDLTVGAPGQSSSGPQAGAVYLARGPHAGLLALEAADARLLGEAAGDQAGQELAAGDLDGDGAPEVVVAARMALDRAGRVYAVDGEASGQVDLASSPVVVTGAAAGDWTGFSVAVGDLDGDGADDLLVGASGTLAGGAALLWYGPVAGALLAADADLRLAAEHAEDEAGSSALLVDLDGGGVDDALIGARGWAEGEGRGAVYLFFGEWPPPVLTRASPPAPSAG